MTDTTHSSPAHSQNTGPDRARDARGARGAPSRLGARGVSVGRGAEGGEGPRRRERGGAEAAAAGREKREGKFDF